jgi:hypothetical protein
MAIFAKFRGASALSLIATGKADMPEPWPRRMCRHHHDQLRWQANAECGRTVRRMRRRLLIAAASKAAFDGLL